MADLSSMVLSLDAKIRQIVKLHQLVKDENFKLSSENSVLNKIIESQKKSRKNYQINIKY